MDISKVLQYRYLVVWACFMHMLLQAGIVYTSGMFYVVWREAFDTDSGLTSWIGALHIGLTCAGAPLSGMLTERIGFRWTVIIGGLISSFGLISSAFAPNIWTLFGTFGFLAAFGIGITFVAASTNATFYFKGRTRAFAIGAVTCGASAGSCMMPYFVTATMNEYGWRGSMLINGGIVLNMCAIGALLRKPPGFQIDKESVKPLCSRNKINGRSIWTVDFVLFLIHMAVSAAGISVVYIHVTAITEYLSKVSRAESNLSLSLIGLANFFGRIATTLIALFWKVDNMLLFCISIILMGIVSVVLPLLTSYLHIMIWSFAFGFLLAPNVSLMQVMTLYFVRLEEINVGFAFVLFVQSFGYTVGAPLAGALYDATGDYSWSFYLGGAFVLFGSVVLLIPVIKHRRLSRNGRVVTDDVLSMSIRSHNFLGSQILEVEKYQNSMSSESKAKNEDAYESLKA